METGLLQFYVGDGKGKTTAAVGQLVRAKGAGLRCEMFQFLKNTPSGECESLGKLEIPVARAETETTKFVFQMSATEKGAYLMEQRKLYTKAIRDIRSGAFDVVALDEVLDLLDMGALDMDALRMALTSRPETVEVLLTGRKIPRRLYDIADYITELNAVKHPFREGMQARKGIEF